MFRWVPRWLLFATAILFLSFAALIALPFVSPSSSVGSPAGAPPIIPAGSPPAAAATAGTTIVGSANASVPARSTIAALPVAQLSLKPGDGAALVAVNCTICHSLAPIIRHDGFTKEVWASEVGKMRKTYGCPIDDATAARIIAYLQANYSTTPPPSAARENVAVAMRLLGRE